MHTTTVALIGICITLLIQLLAGVWWASAINSTVKHLSSNLRQLSMDAEVHHDKQESSLIAMWKKHDLLDKRVTVIETKCDNNHGG